MNRIFIWQQQSFWEVSRRKQSSGKMRFHAAQTAKTAGFVVLGVYDESGKDAVPEMKEICEEYFDRMDAWLAGHK